MTDDLARKMYLAETEAVRQHMAEQEQQATAKAKAALAPLEAKARKLREREHAEHRAAVLRELIAKAEEWDGHITMQELRRMADEQPAEAQPSQQPTVETLARMLSAADVEINHGDYPTYDTLAESGQKQYRQAARYLLKRLHITTKPTAEAQLAVAQPPPGYPDRPVPRDVHDVTPPGGLL